jgi:hypothetical protein
MAEGGQRRVLGAPAAACTAARAGRGPHGRSASTVNGALDSERERWWRDLQLVG